MILQTCIGLKYGMPNDLARAVSRFCAGVSFNDKWLPLVVAATCSI